MRLTMLMAALLLSACTSVPGTPVQTQNPVVATPQTAGVALGAYVDPTGTPGGNAVAAFETAIGRKLAIDNHYKSFLWNSADAKTAQDDITNGRTPMLSVSFGTETKGAPCVPATAILDGTYDATFKQQAADLSAVKGTVLYRLGYEMTDSHCFTGTTSQFYSLPLSRANDAADGAQYIAVWNHIHAFFAGDTNVKFVWAPGIGAYEKGIWSNFYPGADEVDWVAVDMYNKTTTVESVNTYPNWLAFYSATSDLGKPLMISETGAQSAEQQAWVSSIGSSMQSSFPAVRAVVYWDAVGSYNYVLAGDGLAAFKTMGADPYFAGTVQ